MNRPHVVVDTALEDGLLWLIVENIGREAAHGITVTFSRRIMGLGGNVEISALPLFDDLGFLGPGKAHRIVLDTADHFWKNRTTFVFTATARFKDDGGRLFSTRTRHNMVIYRQYPTTR